MTDVRVGVVGCGNIARGIHIPLLQTMSNARLVAIADIDANNRAAAVTLAPQAQQFAGFEELIAAKVADALVICLPPHLHAPAAIAAFKAGMHVYVEKPLAPSVADGERMVHALTDANILTPTIGTIGFNFRYHPQVESVRQRLRDHEIGTLISVRTTFSILPHTLPDWKRDLALGGGALLDLASHHFDLIEYLTATRIAEVFANRAAGQDGVDHIALQLRMTSGAMAQIFVSLGSVEEHRLEFFGTEGKLEIDRTELIAPRYSPATLKGARTTRARHAIASLNPKILLRSPGYEPSFGRCLSAFIAAVASRSPMSPDLNDGLSNLAVVEAAERSIASRSSERPTVTDSPRAPS